MKAMLLHKPSLVEGAPLEWAEVPLPAPGPGEIRLKVSACGICHTDLHIVEGELPLPKAPIIPGHQMVGIVDAVGEGETRFKKGDRVGVPWLHGTCGECSFCRQGRENLCLQARFTGYHVDGGYAQYAIASQGFACPIPKGFPDLEAAPLLCAGIIGFRALRLSEAKPGERLGLFGFGASAHIALQVAVHWGCKVFVFSRSEEHRRLARRLGAALAGGSGEEPPVGLHSAIVFAPAGSVVLDALRALDRGGTLALAGIYMTPIPEMDYARHLYYERTVRSVTNATRQDAEDFLRLAAEIPIRTEIEVFPLEEANRALLLLKEGRIQGAGVLRIPE